MTEPAPFDHKRTPSVKWDGKEWPVPPLVADQLDLIWDDVIELSDILFKQDEEAEPAVANNDFEKLRAGFQVLDRRYGLSNAQYGKMREVVFYGLQRAHPSLTREEFRAVPSPSIEMLMAFLVVRRQSGIYSDFQDRGDEQSSGEAVAATAQSPTSN